MSGYITEEGKAHHGHKWMPAMYATYYGILKDVAMEYGYCLALHGTFSRDMDLIAIPWIEEPKPIEEMLLAFRKKIGCHRSDGLPYDSKGEKPHGRIAYTLSTGGGGYIDISVMPTKT